MRSSVGLGANMAAHQVHPFSGMIVRLTPVCAALVAIAFCACTSGVEDLSPEGTDEDLSASLKVFGCPHNAEGKVGATFRGVPVYCEFDNDGFYFERARQR